MDKTTHYLQYSLTVACDVRFLKVEKKTNVDDNAYLFTTATKSRFTI